MNKIFEFDTHIGDWRVLVQSRDIQNGAIQGRHIASNSVSGDKIALNTIPGRCFQDESITGDMIENNTLVPGKLAKDSVTTRVIKDRNVTPEKLSSRVFDEIIKPPIDDLQNQIDSLTIHGMAVSNHFGNDKHIGISQYALTQAINRIWQKIDDMTGEVTLGIAMTVTPEYYIGEEGCSVCIVAESYDAHGIFEVLDLYIIEGDEERHIYHGEDVEYKSCRELISDTAYVKCKAQILGIEYEVTKKITHYASFWLGAGSGTQSDIKDNIMTNANLIPVERRAYDRSISAGQHIIVVLGESLAPWFVRADMNGMEIAMNQSTVTKDGVNYVVFTSQDTYQAGTYNIDING